MTALALAALALLLSLVAPVALARVRLLQDEPRAAVALWQAGAAAAVLAAVGAALAAPEEVLRALRGTDLGPDVWLLAAALTAAVLAGVIVIRLVVTTVRLGVSLRRKRRRQAELLDLLATARSARVHVLSGQVPLAYCVPGSSPRVVVTEAAVQMLDPVQIDAVVEHERGHLRARHDLVLEAFTALHVAFPRIVRSRLALEAVALLLEMLADDSAARRSGAQPLAGALAQLESTAEGKEVAIRRARLARLYPDGARTRRHRPVLAATVYVLAAATLLVPTIAIVTPWLRQAVAAIGWI